MLRKFIQKTHARFEKWRFNRRVPDQVILNQIHISGTHETRNNSTEEQFNADHNQVDNLIYIPGTQIDKQNIRGLGKQTSKKKQPRTMLVFENTPLEVRNFWRKDGIRRVLNLLSFCQEL